MNNLQIANAIKKFDRNGKWNGTNYSFFPSETLFYSYLVGLREVCVYPQNAPLLIINTNDGFKGYFDCVNGSTRFISVKFISAFETEELRLKEKEVLKFLIESDILINDSTGLYACYRLSKGFEKILKDFDQKIKKIFLTLPSLANIIELYNLTGAIKNENICIKRKTSRQK